MRPLVASFSSRPGLFLLTLLTLFGLPVPLPLAAQDIPGSTEPDFRGGWEVRLEGGAFYFIIVKKGNRASYFYADRNDSTIYPGSWRTFGGALYLEWEEGHTDVIQPIDAANFRLAQYPRGFTGTESPSASGLARRLPDATIGQWTIPPDELEQSSTAALAAEGFFGTWQINDPLHGTYFILVNDDRTAASSFKGSRKGEDGLRGEWRRQGTELHILYDTGHYQIIRERPQDHVTELFPPGADLGVPAAAISARRVSTEAPGRWLEYLDSEKALYERANAFRTLKEANSYFRGNWFLTLDGEKIQEIEISRYGGLEIRGSSVKGQWRSSSGSLYFYWNDGHRAILQPLFLGFVYSIYRPGQPFDGTPARIYPVQPADEQKLEEYRALLIEASQRLRFFRALEASLPPPPPDKKNWWEIDLWPF